MDSSHALQYNCCFLCNIVHLVFFSDYREPTRSRYGHGNVIPTDKLNSHQRTLNQQGHLKVTSAAPALTSPHKQNAVHNAEKIM